MTGWMILGGIALLVALILSMSLVIRFSVDGSVFRVWLGVGPFGKSVFPMAEQDEQVQKPKKKRSTPKAAEKKAPSKEQAGKKEHEPGNVTEMVQLALEAAKGIFPPLGRLIKGFRLTDLRLYIRVGGPDAAQTAIRYGQVCALVHGSLATLKSFMRIQVTEVGIGYDFLQNGITEQVSFKLKLRLATALGQLLRMAWRVLCRVLRVLLKRGRGASKQTAKPAAAGMKK